MPITKELLGTINVEIEAALVAVGKNNSVDIKLGGCRYDNNVATFKLELKALNSDGTAVNVERIDYERYATAFGLDKAWLDEPYTVEDGSEMRIVGLRKRARSRPVIIEKVETGVRFIAAAEVVKRHMLEKRWLDKTFVDRNVEYRIIGFDFPDPIKSHSVVVETVKDGKKRSFPLFVIRESMKAAGISAASGSIQNDK